MKKTLAILLAVAVVFCAVGQVAAAGFEFEDFTSPLILTIYKTDGSGNELNVDLGSIQTTDFGASNQTLAAAGVVDYAAIGSFADLGVGIYATDFFGDHNMFATTNKTTVPDIRVSNMDNFNSGVASRADNASIAAIMPQSSNFSYANVMGYGSMSSLNRDVADAAPSLSALASVGFIDMYLYDFNYDGDLITGAGTDYRAVLRISADGSVIANPVTSTVPLPGALVLFASGLVGLVGIRRKKA